jgi:hypothetical protein
MGIRLRLPGFSRAAAKAEQKHNRATINVPRRRKEDDGHRMIFDLILNFMERRKILSFQPSEIKINLR